MDQFAVSYFSDRMLFRVHANKSIIIIIIMIIITILNNYYLMMMD